jgi:PAS domain S-box-containing protein
MQKAFSEDVSDNWQAEARLVRKDGSVLPTWLTVTVIRSETGTPLRLFGQIIDMTDVRRSEEALRFSEERYRTLFERIPVALYRSTPDGQILDANPALVELMGFHERDDLIALQSHDVYVDPEARATWHEAISAHGTILGFEAQLRRRDESRFWAQDSARIVRSADGEIMYYEGAIIDVTAQKTAEEARLRLARIIEATPDIVVVMDPNGWITYANTAARDFFSIGSDQQPPYLHVSQALERDTMRVLVGDIIPTLGDGHAWTGEFNLISADGSKLPVSAVGLAHHAEDGSLGRFSAVLRDVSVQAEATQQLRDLVRTKDEFVASVSHELRTPLTAVVGLAHELGDHWRMFEEEELEDLIRVIADQATEVSAIVQDLLVAARADIGSITINPTIIDISKEVAAALMTVPEELMRRIDLDISTVIAWADPGRFRQIIRNLLTNALRYGGPEIGIDAHNDHGRAVVNVIDNGSGIESADRRRIFDPYFRAHDTPSQPASVGLGLAVSRQLAELMNGELTYDYSAGLSTFSLRLPVEPPTRYSGSSN